MAPRSSPAHSPVYIFLGPELGKKHSAIEEIRKKISDNAAREETVFYAGETPVDQIVFEMQNQSLFAQSRLFLIKNAEAIKKKDEIDSLASCVRELEEGTVLIIISEETRLAAGLDNLVPKENKRVFYELFENEKNEWVRNYFTQRGFRIDADGIETVLELVENNTEALARECSRLMHFLRDPQKPEQAQTISAAEVEQWLSHNREESAFTLFSRVAAGDFPKALESLKAILAEKKFQDRTPQIMLAGIASCFRKLRSYHALLKSGQAGTYELKSIGISAPASRADYASAARRYTADAADACLALTAEYDLLLRTMGNSFESILLDAWLVKICGLAWA
jgi:DNA polymerase-3 subunit delta